MRSPETHTLCIDVGSTFTKATLIDHVSATVVGHAEHPTTIETDVLDGVDACVDELGAAGVAVLVCSSAGGGLRVSVVGNEELVTAEAGSRVALSSGGKVVAVVAASAGAFGLEQLNEPDVVLLTGGTDGGNAEVIVAAAGSLVTSGWRGPVVVAGNVDAVPAVLEVLEGLPVVVADNVVPKIGVLRPEGARAAIREVFLSHVIGGKGLSAREDGAAFVSIVRGATPDVVLTGVEMLARSAGDVVVVDVGGATTDVHSVVTLDPEDGALARDVVAPTSVTRTVEGDLGMRWSAATTVEAARRGGDVGQPGARTGDLEEAARLRSAQPSYLPCGDDDLDIEEAIARLAVGLALRRHAGRARVVVGPGGRILERSGTDLRAVSLVVASGGVLRHGRPAAVDRVLAGSIGEDLDGGWQLPEHPRVVVDADHVLAAVGLLATDHPDEALRLARSVLGQA